ncbi:alanine dehydrogenase [Nocardia tengchongensis]|uniref:alanine dehydrogenase n=1 Tax=Nocardia tengchongensis TaxID=2055889 RepID=UPI0036932662
MRIGIPREVKAYEHRVACTPAGARELVARGHDVVVEARAGLGSGFTDDAYRYAGARILESADDVWAAGDLLLKVKEPVAAEYSRLRHDQVLFTYLHLAASKECTDALLSSGITALAYETVTASDNSLPLLAPMSEVAGRLAPQVGAYHMMRIDGGSGVLMGGVPGVCPARVVVLGAGVAGRNAIAIAHGMRADVTVLDVNIARLREIDEQYHSRVRTVYSNQLEVENLVREADLVIGAVLVPGAKAPILISNDLVASMKSGSVLVDIAIDQGGCFADSRATTHTNPTYMVHESLFYCVANMPGAVPQTSTVALTNATLPYVIALADLGWRDAIAADPGLGEALSTHAGALFSESVAAAHGYVVHTQAA